MSGTAVPERILRFISEHVDSVEQLEVLLLLARTPGRPWTADAVSLELRTSPASAEQRLASLARTGMLVDEPPAYRFDESDVDRVGIVRELADIYAERRVTVIGLIYSKPLDAIREFAEAFRLKDKKNG